MQTYADVETGFSYPHDTIQELTDGEAIYGIFKISRSTETLIASAQNIQTKGKFVTSANAPINGRTTLRRARDGLFFSIIGDAKTAVPQASIQLKSYEAEITDRPTQYFTR